MGKRKLRNTKNYSSILLCIFFVLLTSCSYLGISFQKNPKRILLTECSEKLREFKCEGVAEVNYKAFSIRKDFVLRKNTEAVRLDIVESGIFGLSPTPMFSLYIDSLITIKPQIKFLKKNINNKETKALSSTFINIHKLILDNSKKIIEDGILKINDIELIFSDEMLLQQIKSNKEKLTLNFLYDFSGNITELKVHKAEKSVMNIKIDKISYKKIDVPILK